jgi:hypothetical protein
MMFSKNIGGHKYTFSVEGGNLFELFMEAQKISFNDVFECGLCKSKLLYPKAYITKKGGYNYIKIVCVECGASVTFGEKKEPKDTFYLRKNEDRTLAWEKFEKKENGHSEDNEP